MEDARIWSYYHQQDKNCGYAAALEDNDVFDQDKQQ
jgi:hypothetical protein